MSRPSPRICPPPDNQPLQLHCHSQPPASLPTLYLAGCRSPLETSSPEPYKRSSQQVNKPSGTGHVTSEIASPPGNVMLRARSPTYVPQQCGQVGKEEGGCEATERPLINTSATKAMTLPCPQHLMQKRGWGTLRPSGEAFLQKFPHTLFLLLLICTPVNTCQDEKQNTKEQRAMCSLTHLFADALVRLSAHQRDFFPLPKAASGCPHEPTPRLG